MPPEACEIKPRGRCTCRLWDDCGKKRRNSSYGWVLAWLMQGFARCTDPCNHPA